ncbi:thiamine pyrophosphate-binding protein [Streptomyces shenzhenensis]|uniref:thiamine pyrophosphate-binding protein n=1 Tax=Streptomyces shenzhenensis TaxID=943815 RepID=UPI0015F057DC|nr:thiamine pyrophosphate-binding protein [Streptomyces shenzhenensis]
MESVTGGDLVVRTLQRAGVETAFGINGAYSDPIYQAALDAGLRIVDVRHEMNAGHAAEGYARVRGDVGVALVTAGGAFTNVLTSIANAHLDRTPVVYIAASGPLDQDQMNDLNAGIDQVAMAAPVTKFAHRVTRPELIPRLLAQAVRIARSAPHGPVLIDIPFDVIRASVDPGTVKDYRLSADVTGAAPEATLDEIIALIWEARRPVAVVGKSFATPEARAALHDFAARTGVPLLADHDGLGALAGSKQRVGLLQSLLSPGEPARPDVVLMLGIRFGLKTALGSGALIPKTARIVQIDADARELGRLQDVDLGIQADPAATVAALVDRLKATDGAADHAAWLTAVSQQADERLAAVEAVAGTEAEDGGAIHPFHAVKTIAGAVPEGAVVVADGALTELWLSETIASSPLSHYLGQGYLSSMGLGLGTAIGAKSAVGETPTILVTGDGAVGYSLAEFDSMVRAGLPVVVIVLNNQAWGATWHAQEIIYGRDRVTNNSLANGSYSGVARALGADGVEVTSLDQLAPAIRDAVQSGRPTCIDVRVRLDPMPPEEKAIMGASPFGVVENITLASG